MKRFAARYTGKDPIHSSSLPVPARALDDDKRNWYLKMKRGGDGDGIRSQLRQRRVLILTSQDATGILKLLVVSGDDVDEQAFKTYLTFHRVNLPMGELGTVFLCENLDKQFPGWVTKNEFKEIFVMVSRKRGNIVAEAVTGRQWMVSSCWLAGTGRVQRELKILDE